MSKPPLTEDQQDRALEIIAAWLGPKMGYEPGESAPTGESAAYTAQGPMLHRGWTWPGQPTPTILLEGGPYDWAVEASMDDEVIALFKQIGIFAEPYAGYALCLYPDWD